MARKPIAWHLDELAHAGLEHVDPNYVARYDRKASTDWSEDVAALLALGVGATSTVVDVGAGTGAFVRALAPHVARVIAVDPSKAMVAAMSDYGVEAVRAGFLSYEHKGDPPDAVFTRNALHHLPDFWKAVALERAANTLDLFLATRANARTRRLRPFLRKRTSRMSHSTTRRNRHSYMARPRTKQPILIPVAGNELRPQRRPEPSGGPGTGSP